MGDPLYSFAIPINCDCQDKKGNDVYKAIWKNYIEVIRKNSILICMMFKKKCLPTDIEILNTIYDEYYETFTSFTKGDSSRETKIYIPIDIALIAKKFDIDPDIIFGRLYYHLEKKYGYKKESDSHVHLFSLKTGKDSHCINFPYAASVLADLRAENKKFLVTTVTAVFSLIISIISIYISVFGLPLGKVGKDTARSIVVPS